MPRREIIGEAVVRLGIDDARYLAELEAMKRKTISTIDAIDRQKATIPVDIEVRDARAKLKELNSEIKEWKREFGDAKGKDKAALNGIIKQIEARKALVQAQIDEAQAHRQNIGYINRAKTLDERRARQEEANRKKAEEDKRRERKQAEDDKVRADKNAVDAEMRQLRLERERLRTQREIEKSKKAEAKTLDQTVGLKPEEISAARSKARKRFEDQHLNSSGTYHDYRAANRDKIEAWAREHEVEIRDKADLNAAGTIWVEEQLKEAEDRAVEDLERHRDRKNRDSANREHKRRGWWYRVTAGGSNTPMETFRKLLKEPVRMGPFSISMRGVLAAMTTLNPILRMVIGSLSSMAGSLGAATLAFGALGIAAVGGFGQMAGGIFMVLQPMIKEFKMASQATNAYAVAVAKYGKNSEKAKNKQDQMNSVLKSMSPTARAAYKDLAIVQTTFERMTMKARPHLDGLLRSGMNAFRQASPNFSKNTVRATGIASTEISTIFDRINSSRNRGNDPLNTMFVNANKALGPLIRGMGYLGEALAHIGASASRYLAPLALGFARAMDKILDKTEKTKSLNGTIDRLMQDLVSVGRLLGSSTRLLKNFFNAGRPTGRGLFDSLTKTFNDWNKKITSETGKAKLQAFFEAAAVTARRFGETIIAIGQAFTIFTRLSAPLAALVAGLVDAFNAITGAVAGSNTGLRVLQGLLTGLVVGMTVFKVVTALTSGTFGRFMATLIMDLRTGGGAFAAFGATAMTSTAMATMGLSLIVGILAGVAAGFLSGGDHADEMRKKIDGAKNSSDALAASLADTMSGQGMLKLDLRDQKAALGKMTKGTPEYERQLKTIADTQRRINQGEQELTGQIRDRTGDRKEEVRVAKESLATAQETYDAHKMGFDLTDEDMKGQQVTKDLAAAKLTLVQAENKALGDRFELMRAQANQANLPKGKVGENIRQLLGELGGMSKAGYNIAAKLSVTAPTADALRAEADAARTALQKGLSEGAIMKIIADGKDAQDVINRLTKATTKYVRLEAIDNVSSVFSSIKSNFESIVGTLGVHPTKGAEGYMPAASGYTKNTAAGSARRRPMRRAMGKFNEPTFLVGEENRSEYVIATNPAYRAQNQEYLAQAAGDLGMMVVPAAGGWSPSIWAKAYADTPAALTKRDKKAKKDLAAVNTWLRIYNKTKKKSISQQENYAGKKRKQAYLQRLVNDSNKNRTISGSTQLKTFNTQLNSFDSRMSLAEKQGNTAAFLSAQRGEDAVIGSLLYRYNLALKGTKNSATRAQIQADIDSLTEKRFDNKNKTIGGYAGALAEAQIGQLSAQLLSSQNENVINSMFGTTTGALGDIIASGGPRMSGKGGSGLAEGGVNIHINTLTAHDPRHEELIRNSVVGALSTQGGVQASSMAVG